MNQKIEDSKIYSGFGRRAKEGEEGRVGKETGAEETSGVESGAEGERGVGVEKAAAVKDGAGKGAGAEEVARVGIKEAAGVKKGAAKHELSKILKKEPENFASEKSVRVKKAQKIKKN